MKSDASILNFARGELVDSEALKALFDAGHKGKYVTDFPEVSSGGTRGPTTTHPPPPPLPPPPPPAAAAAAAAAAAEEERTPPPVARFSMALPRAS